MNFLGITPKKMTVPPSPFADVQPVDDFRMTDLSECYVTGCDLETERWARRCLQPGYAVHGFWNSGRPNPLTIPTGFAAFAPGDSPVDTVLIPERSMFAGVIAARLDGKPKFTPEILERAASDFKFRWSMCAYMKTGGCRPEHWVIINDGVPEASTDFFAAVSEAAAQRTPWSEIPDLAAPFAARAAAARVEKARAVANAAGVDLDLVMDAPYNIVVARSGSRGDVGIYTGVASIDNATRIPVLLAPADGALILLSQSPIYANQRLGGLPITPATNTAIPAGRECDCQEAGRIVGGGSGCAAQYETFLDHLEPMDSVLRQTEIKRLYTVWAALSPMANAPEVSEEIISLLS